MHVTYQQTLQLMLEIQLHGINVDTAAHTVTGGSPADGPSGVFDSSLVMARCSLCIHL